MQINKKHLCSCVLLFIIINFPSDDFYSLTLIVSSIARFFCCRFQSATCEFALGGSFKDLKSLESSNTKKTRIRAYSLSAHIFSMQRS